MEEESGESSSSVIAVQNLEPGDHIFSERKRNGYSYSHHGIYVAHNAVIHLQGPHNIGETLVYVFDQNGGVDFGIWAHWLLHCFRYYGHDTGRLKRCLGARVTSRRDRRDCQARFLGDDDGLLYIHEKRVQGEWRDAISRQAAAMDVDADHQRFFVESSGSKRVQICKLTSKKTPEKVVDTAVQLLEKGYSNYHFIRNNCEHFAVHCKTGLAMSIQVEAFGLGRVMDRMLRAAVTGIAR
uniref:LRAT domain-containing protein n=1 Tax=Kalanchoe fedtschenkoi TaxID=63787 RepID=A0A7N0RAW5_KALFE